MMIQTSQTADYPQMMMINKLLMFWPSPLWASSFPKCCTEYITMEMFTTIGLTLIDMYENIIFNTKILRTKLTQITVYCKLQVLWVF
jgi:hypothetical protein